MNPRALTIPGQGVVLDGSATTPEVRPIATLILCHGLPRGLPDPGDGRDDGYPGLAKSFAARGYATVIFNFRGTGRSTGSLEIARWPDDLRSVLEFLDKDEELRSDTYGVIGFSAGGASAIAAAAADERIDPLVACAAPADFDFLRLAGNERLYFDHYKNIGMIRPDYDESPEQWALNFSELRSLRAMADVRARHVLLLHGDRDDTVPVEHLARLAQARPERVRATVLPGAGHQLRKEPAAVKEILSFLNEIQLGG